MKTTLLILALLAVTAGGTSTYVKREAAALKARDAGLQERAALFCEPHDGLIRVYVTPDRRFAAAQCWGGAVATFAIEGEQL